ncbi:MAG TPA: alpha/beta hydrolase [Gemmatimonadaceae bacterium]|jgi:predicted esterase|nr:alpha/beta hydrolase [Gemmatimonadaceae bacterium]
MNDDLGFTHRFIPGQDSSAETLIVLHGTGGDENSLVGIAQAVAPGASIISPRGNVLENGAPRFFKRLAEGVFDQNEVRSRGQELARFIRAAIINYNLDPGRVFALGYSNGANAASTVMLVDPGALQGAILLRPMHVYESPSVPDLTGTSVLISAGRMDPIVPTESVERLRDTLESGGATVTLNWQLVGHNLVPSEMREAAEWLALQRARV